MTVYRSKTIWEKDRTGVLIPRCREIHVSNNKYPKPTEVTDGARTDRKPGEQLSNGDAHKCDSQQPMAADPA